MQKNVSFKMEKKIWLSSPHMGGSEIKYVQQAFDENWIAPLGPNVNGLESDLENFLGENVHVAALSSGSAAIHLALILLGVQRDDEVICQSFTFSASCNAILYLGAKPVFIDSEKDTWNICPNSLRNAILDRISKGKKPKAIIAVCLYGMPYKVDEVNAIAKEFDIPVIEDSAEGLGSSYKGRKVGTFGDLSILSFNGNKIITTSGGGALVVKDPALKKKAVFLSTQAKDDAPHYEHTEIGYNYRMSNVCAGIGRGQMEVLEERVRQRRANHDFYLDVFKDVEGVKVFCEPSGDYFSNHWLTVITLDNTLPSYINREYIREEFLKKNIESRPLWKPMHLQPLHKEAAFYGGNVSEDLFDRGLCLPSGSSLTDDERRKIRETIEEIFSLQKCL